MQPIGKIARSYAEGLLWDDADVALLHLGASEAYAPVTEPLVNVRATADRLVELGLATQDDRSHLLEHAGEIHFAGRDIASLFNSDNPVAWLAGPYATYHVNQKALDAAILVDVIHGMVDERTRRRSQWHPRQSQFWRDRPRLTLD